MSLTEFSASMLPPIETELQHQVARLDAPSTKLLHEMLTYHMGWTGRGAGQAATGKRIRPLLVLLSAAAWSDSWKDALPAAAAVELVHNFSLVHDDIQDNSATRRGRPALWKEEGMAMAINAGDSLFTIAHLAVLDLVTSFPGDLILASAALLQEACLDLTRGQFLDLAYQRRRGLTIQDYWTMIDGKTAALLGAGVQIGALLGSRDKTSGERMKTFGRLLGLAFQVKDDILGIWGDEVVTGKPIAGDLLEGKSSLPVLFGIEREPRFAERWLSGPLQREEVRDMAKLLRDCGAFDYASSEGKRLTDEALAALDSAGPRGAAGSAIHELTLQLLGRAR